MVVDPSSPHTSRRSQRRNDCLPVDREANYVAPALDQGMIERQMNKRTTPWGPRSDA
jgi:hypothetical protein